MAGLTGVRVLWTQLAEGICTVVLFDLQKCFKLLAV